MANLRESQQETFAAIDTAIAMVNKVSSVLNLLDHPSASITFATNPMGMLVNLMKHLGITYEELVNYISYLLSAVLPTIELGVKGILLTNIKQMIACSIDPRIPDAYRKGYVDSEGLSNTSGFTVTINTIDVLDKLQVNPLSEDGKCLYFGTENVSDIYKFVRADDMDAFLWFVIHKTKFPVASIVKETPFTITQPFSGNPSNDGWGMNVTEGDSFLEDVKLVISPTYAAGTQTSRMLPGNVFSHDADAKTVAMCINVQKEKQSGSTYEKVVASEIIPVSDDRYSINWYIRPKYNFGRSLGWGMTAKSYAKYPRKYDKERAICNFSFKNATTNQTKNGITANELWMRILPKPAIHIPKVPLESPLNYRKLLFNAKGEPDSSGKYSYNSSVFNDDKGTWDTDNKYLKYTISKDVTLTINRLTGHYDIENGNYSGNTKFLQECYPGLTVYEFNYDYVMSMRLFDAKTIIMSVLNSIFNSSIGVNANINSTYSLVKIINDEKIKTIVKNILEQDDSEISDCYYTFSNEKYAQLLKKAEERKLNEQSFGTTTRTASSLSSVISILSEYDGNADLHEQETVISRTIQEASVALSDAANDEDQASIKLTFLFDFIEELTAAIVNSILSPKVLLLLSVNEQLMHNNVKNMLTEQPTFEELLKSMESIIVSITKEIRDVMIKELLKFILKWLNPLKETMLSLLFKERINEYTDLVKELMTACDMSEFYSLLLAFLKLFKSEQDDTILDTVDYPDIDTSIKSTDLPSTNEC